MTNAHAEWCINRLDSKRCDCDTSEPVAVTSKTKATRVWNRFLELEALRIGVPQVKSLLGDAKLLQKSFEQAFIECCSSETREPPRQLELTNELRWILGRPCFMVIPMVQCLRKMGRHIDTKAEDEQAVAIHWMLSLYLEHGADKWRDEAEKILKEGQRQANELKADPQHGAKARDFVEYDSEGGVRIDLARYLRTPAGQAQLEALGGKKAEVVRQPRSTRYCDYDLCADTFDPAHSNDAHEKSEGDQRGQ